MDEADFDSVAESVADADSSARYLNLVTARLERYSDRITHSQYLAETGLSHATYESALAYYDVDAQELLGEAKNTEPQSPFCAVHLLSALFSFGKIFESDAVTLKLAGPAERIRLPTIEDRLAKGWDIPARLESASAKDIT